MKVIGGGGGGGIQVCGGGVCPWGNGWEEMGGGEVCGDEDTVSRLRLVLFWGQLPTRLWNFWQWKFGIRTSILISTVLK